MRDRHREHARRSWLSYVRLSRTGIRRRSVRMSGLTGPKHSYPTADTRRTLLRHVGMCRVVRRADRQRANGRIACDDATAHARTARRARHAPARRADLARQGGLRVEGGRRRGRRARHVGAAGESRAHRGSPRPELGPRDRPLDARHPRAVADRSARDGTPRFDPANSRMPQAPPQP